MKKIIAIDMDEVLADVTPKLLNLYEAEFGYRPKETDYQGRKIYETPEAYKLRDNLHNKGFFRDLPVMENSQAVVKELHERYTIYIITASTEFKYSMLDKHEWLQEHFPFISWKNYIFCGRKSFLKADYLIDDKASNLIPFEGKGLLYSAAHNVYEDRFTRVNNWLEVKAFFESL